MSDSRKIIDVPQDPVKRRLLMSLGVVLGSAATTELLKGNALSVALAYEAKPDDAARQTRIFDAPKMAVLREVCQTVIPKTETPGAGDLDTHGFIDNQLFYCFDKQTQSAISDVIDKLSDVAMTTQSKTFDLLSLQHKTAVLKHLDTGQDEFTKDDKAVFRLLKSLIVLGFYTSEIGATEELTYLAFPGDYKGSVPYESIGTAWGSHAFF